MFEDILIALTEEGFGPRLEAATRKMAVATTLTEDEIVQAKKEVLQIRRPFRNLREYVEILRAAEQPVTPLPMNWEVREAQGQKIKGSTNLLESQRAEEDTDPKPSTSATCKDQPTTGKEASKPREESRGRPLSRGSSEDFMSDEGPVMSLESNPAPKSKQRPIKTRLNLDRLHKALSGQSSVRMLYRKVVAVPEELPSTSQNVKPWVFFGNVECAKRSVVPYLEIPKSGFKLGVGEIDAQYVVVRRGVETKIVFQVAGATCQWLLPSLQLHITWNPPYENFRICRDSRGRVCKEVMTVFDNLPHTEDGQRENDFDLDQMLEDERREPLIRKKARSSRLKALTNNNNNNKGEKPKFPQFSSTSEEDEGSPAAEEEGAVDKSQAEAGTSSGSSFTVNSTPPEPRPISPATKEQLEAFYRGERGESPSKKQRLNQENDDSCEDPRLARRSRREMKKRSEDYELRPSLGGKSSDSSPEKDYGDRRMSKEEAKKEIRARLFAPERKSLNQRVQGACRVIEESVSPSIGAGGDVEADTQTDDPGLAPKAEPNEAEPEGMMPESGHGRQGEDGQGEFEPPVIQLDGGSDPKGPMGMGSALRQYFWAAHAIRVNTACGTCGSESLDIKISRDGNEREMSTSTPVPGLQPEANRSQPWFGGESIGEPMDTSEGTSNSVSRDFPELRVPVVRREIPPDHLGDNEESSDQDEQEGEVTDTGSETSESLLAGIISWEQDSTGEAFRDLPDEE